MTAPHPRGRFATTRLASSSSRPSSQCPTRRVVPTDRAPVWSPARWPWKWVSAAVAGAPQPGSGERRERIPARCAHQSVAPDSCEIAATGSRRENVCEHGAMSDVSVLLPAAPITTIDDFLAAGGGEGLRAARALGPGGDDRRDHGERAARAGAEPGSRPGRSGRRSAPPAAAPTTPSPTAPRASRRRSRTGR